MRSVCKAEVDRSGSCFRCGKANHLARFCQEAPFCVLCSGRGERSDHRLGSTACLAVDHPKVRPTLPMRGTVRSETRDLGVAMEV